MDSIITSKVLCKAYPLAIHVSIKRNIDLIPQGSTLRLVRSYLPTYRIIDLSKRYNLHIYDLPISDLYKDKDLLEKENIPCVWATTKDTLAYAVWEDSFITEDKPLIVKTTQDYMKWKLELPNTLPLHYAYELIDQKFGCSVILNKLIDGDDTAIEVMLKEGNEIAVYVDTMNELLNKELSFDAKLNDHDIICANIPGANSMVFSNNLDMGVYDAAMIFRYQPNINKLRNTLYAIAPDINVGKVCDNLGGGGHKDVGGFTSLKLPFTTTASNAINVDYTQYLDKNLLTAAVNKHIYANVHGYQTNAFYGEVHGEPAVFYNSPYLTNSDFFTNINTEGCKVKVLFCLNGRGLYRIACQSVDGTLLDDRFGSLYGTYSIDTKPSLDGCVFKNTNIQQEVF